MREGELLALPWVNVITEEGKESVTVTERLYRGRIAAPKTKAGYRVIPVEANAAALLRDQAREGRHSHFGLVFPAPEGGYWETRNFLRRVWNPTREAAGFPDLHFHDLRHFYVTHVRHHSGLPSAVTEELVGHDDDRIHRHYTHELPGTASAYREAMGAIFKRPKEESQA